jgi:hypothetical protein
MLSLGNITRDEFDEALGRYPALIKSISTSKTREYILPDLKEILMGTSGKGRSRPAHT